MRKTIRSSKPSSPRAVGANGHTAFEVFLKGGASGDGRWVLLDHDLSTVIYNKDGTALLSLAEIHKDWKRLTDRQFLPGRQHGWLVCGLHPGDGSSYARYQVAEYLAAVRVRVPDDGMSEDGARLYLATRLDEITVPEPFAHEAEVIALGFAPEPLRAIKLPNPDARK